MSDTALAPEPWSVLLGLISPMLAITGNVLGGAYTLSGVLFIWVLSPILDVLFGESESPRPPEVSTPFERLLWVTELHFVMLATFFYFVASRELR